MLDKLEAVKRDPTALTAAVSDEIELLTSGQRRIVDPNNPFTFLMDAACHLAATSINESLVLIRKQYPTLAHTFSDLYLHLSDRDYDDLFALPSQAEFVMLFDEEELKSKVVYDSNVGYSKLVIPRHTRLSVLDLDFTLNYPIEIRLLQYGGIQVVYDNSIPYPLKVLENRDIVNDRVKLPDSPNPLLRIKVDVDQVRIDSKKFEISPSVGFNKLVPLEDRFVLGRAWLLNNGKWKEVPVQHQDIVYGNGLTVFAVVEDGYVEYRIPPSLINANNKGLTLRIDTYTSKGVVDVDLSELQVNQFSAEWLSYDEDDRTFSSPLDTFETMLVTSYHHVQGGRDSLTFEQVKERVEKGSVGTRILPITEHQFNASARDRGYELIKDVDNVTDRVFFATRELPQPDTSLLNSGANSAIKKILLDFDDLYSSNGVFNNGNSVTLSPDVLFEDNSGKTDILSPNDIARLKSLPNEGKVIEINNRKLLFTPFYYVFDNKQNQFETRAYHLDIPEIVNKSFVKENELLQTQISVDGYFITKTPSGYKITITTLNGLGTGNLVPEDMVVQLSYVPVGELNYGHLLGTFDGYVESGWVYTFNIETNHYFNSNHDFEITNFKMIDDLPRRLLTSLTHNFEILFFLSERWALDKTKTKMDEKLADWLVTGDFMALSEESIKVKFGSSLDKLWTGSKIVAGPVEYERHLTDEVMVYKDNIYEHDETGSIKLIEGPNGEFDINLLHAKDTPVLIDGEQQYIHREGDVKLVDGEPVISKDRSINFLVDLYMVEGVFSLADDPKVVKYKNSLSTHITQWLFNDIDYLNKRLLERTELYLYPQNTMGSIQVIVGENLYINILAEQTIKVSYYLTKLGYENNELRSELAEHAKKTVSNHIGRITINRSSMLKDLTEGLPDEVVDVNVNGLGGDENYHTLTLANPAEKCSIKKKAVVSPDGKISVDDAIEVEYILHRRF